MTAHTIKGEIAFSCDECPETYTPDGIEEFGVAWDDARSLGWRAFKVGSTFEHLCPACARNDGSERGR